MWLGAGARRKRPRRHVVSGVRASMTSSARRAQRNRRRVVEIVSSLNTEKLVDVFAVPGCLTR